ncbi:MAG TPA: C40 family peptidase [Pseudolysinimonas sp.]|jgi:cell wall-associated NlpC family hydrolase
MFVRRRPRGAAAAVASAGIAIATGLALAVSSATLVQAAPAAAAAPTVNYPSWGDVQNAKASQAAKQAEVTKIQGILTQLSTQADALGKVAEQKAELYNQARNALDAATKKKNLLQDQVDTAQAKAAKSSKRASAVIAQLAQTGGGNISLGVLFGSAKNTDQLLSTLGTADRLSQSSEQILKQAQFDKNTASSLTADAKAAEKKRQSLSDDAQTANDAAKAASDAATAQLAQQQAAANTMYAQLASLKNTTASVEEQYQLGVEEEARQNAVKNPPSAPIINPNPGQPVASAVYGAISYAEAQLGKPYALGGAGPTYWDCSGLTLMSYRAVGIAIGTHSATNQYNTMRAQGKLVNLSQLAPGDLLFYTDGGGDMYHVAMAIGGNQMIEAPRPGVPVRIVAIRYGDLMPYAGRPSE